MHRRSFGTAVTAWLAAMFGLRKAKSNDERTVRLPYNPETTNSASLTFYPAFVTIDGIDYRLPYNGVEIINTTGRVIPAGTPICWGRAISQRGDK